VRLKFGVAVILSFLVLRSETQAQEVANLNLGTLAATAEPVTQAQLALPQQAPSDIRVQLGKSILITSQEPLSAFRLPIRVSRRLLSFRRHRYSFMA
jgi:hypothetical protein